MSLTPPPGGLLLVEPLEARIAPTGLIGLTNNTAYNSDPNYVTYATPPSGSHLGFVPASTYVPGLAGTNVFAMKLSGSGGVGSNGHSNGDELVVFNPVQGFNLTNPFLQAVNGNIIAFFQDKNGDGQVQSNELVGLSLGKNTSVTVNGNVNGDVVTNLAKDGNSLLLNGVGKPGQGIAGLNIVGNITGNLLSGGNIDNVTITGTVNNVLAGTATDGVTYNFGGNAAVTTGTISEGAFKVAKIGASITNLNIIGLTSPTITQAIGSIHAGDGGAGAAGGALAGITIQADPDSFNLLSGNGGDGTAAFKGGGGGNISSVLIQGVSNSVVNHPINILAGHGGNNDAFKGGSGGSISGVATSFDNFDQTSNTGQVSGSLLAQNLIVHAGNGGNGLRGGKGGSVDGSNLFGSIPDDGAVNNGAPNAEIQVIAGDGGQATIPGQGHGGAGGNIGQINAENLDTVNQLTSGILIQSGTGGPAKAGGNINGITLLGGVLDVEAGNGGYGINVGGGGGSINTVNVLSLTNLFAQSLTLNAGAGGNANLGNGGTGGDVAAIRVIDAQLVSLVINSPGHAGGGTGFSGLGGAGGRVMDVQITDSDILGSNSIVPTAVPTVTIRSGLGGAGQSGGGVGGDISSFQMFGANFSYTVTAGAGGNVLDGGFGDGGAGGTLQTVGISNQPVASIALLNPAGLTGAATAGAGGNGPGAGGAGGALTQVNLAASSDITLTAGIGGVGGLFTAGRGGDVTTCAGNSISGSVKVFAGNGGVGGAFGAAGGAINGFVAAAATDIFMASGNGGAGGAGGSITAAGTSLNAATNAPNVGGLTVLAGNGSSGNGVAGAGGSIIVFDGFVGLAGVTSLQAGTGGGDAGAVQSGAGGMVDQVKLTGTTTDYGTTQLVKVAAGDAGQAGQAKRGAAGGSVTNTAIYNLDIGTTVHHVSAGNGANGLRRGGAGGSINQVNVGAGGQTDADIGIRSGAAFGYADNQAGGLFAGVGGTGAKRTGLNGSVTNITATAISSIVAGRDAVPQLVALVDGIDLEGLVATQANPDGSFINFDTANLVGSVQNPLAAGASTYKQGDGLIAALTLTNNRDFAPEALLTLDASGNLVLVDYRQPNPAPATIPAPPYL